MQTLRGIVFEWRKILKEPIRQTAAFQYLMKQYRKHQGAEREQLEDKYYHKTGITTEEAAAKVEYPAWFQNKWLLVLQFMNNSMACQRRLLDLSSLIICKSEQNGISESVDRIFP
ncbi:hypothetical protein T01_1392, partial [Trichinella spiralis]